MTIDAFLFDIGNVLIDWNPDHLLAKLLPDGAAVQAFRQEAVTQARILEMDKGQDWSAQLDEIAAAVPHHLETARAYRARWVETVSGSIQDVVDLMARLKGQGYPIYALSNYGVENFKATLAVYPFLDTFDGRIVSGYEGLIKPDPAIFELAIRRFALDPTRTLFIDDRPENTEAAAACGFQVHTFTTPARLIEVLKQDRIG